MSTLMTEQKDIRDIYITDTEKLLNKNKQIEQEFNALDADEHKFEQLVQQLESAL